MPLYPKQIIHLFHGLVLNHYVNILISEIINVKVILYSYLILKKMNERIIDNISTNIHNEHIKTKYIPSYIFENEGKIFKKLNKLAVF